MKQEKRFYIPISQTERPLSKRTIYVDGAADAEFREGRDLELSHWLPNRTENHYKSGTSTEICFNFLETAPGLSYDLVVNNHLDTDGLLSVFVLCYPTFALQHKETLCKAAKSGDFLAWSEGKALKLFQEGALLYKKLQKQKVTLQKTYEICFELIVRILNGQEDKTDVTSLLEDQFTLIEKGKIERQELTPRFVSYFVPRTLSKGRLQEFLQIPHFNEPFSERLAFWPQVRNRLDEEKVQLVAIESEKGIHYDLWYPGYVWADTKGLWRPRGLIPPEKTEDNHLIDCPPFSKAIQKLNAMETGFCHWKWFSGIGLFDKKNPRKFPVVASTLWRENETKESHLPLETVAFAFQKIFNV